MNASTARQLTTGVIPSLIATAGGIGLTISRPPSRSLTRRWNRRNSSRGIETHQRVGVARFETVQNANKQVDALDADPPPRYNSLLNGKMEPRMKINSRLFTASLVLAAAGLIGGCTTTREEDIHADLTPELDTLHERPADMDNSWTLMMDENGRMFMQDLGRAFYTNRPSRLTPEPVPRP